MPRTFPLIMSLLSSVRYKLLDDGCFVVEEFLDLVSLVEEGVFLDMVLVDVEDEEETVVLSVLVGDGLEIAIADEEDEETAAVSGYLQRHC